MMSNIPICKRSWSRGDRRRMRVRRKPKNCSQNCVWKTRGKIAKIHGGVQLRKISSSCFESNNVICSSCACRFNSSLNPQKEKRAK